MGTQKEKEIKFLEGLLKSNLFKFPIKWKHSIGDGWTSEQIFDSKKGVKAELTSIKMAQKKFYSCFFCNHYFKENVGGRDLPMDKREQNDNGFGDTFVCYKCVPKRFGRL
jgi:hypothetical protein